ncbi:MAG: HNH endonuclease [archaeon]|nr:HNH endonuclease [archaeon]
MSDFRKQSPKRRDDAPVSQSYKEYKQLLREDFHQRCGYCGDHDFFRETYYEVDHFVPKKFMKSIKENDYNNLVYSCRSCNNFKRAKWPSGDEMIPNDGKVGFVDPCSVAYPLHFKRLDDGSIKSITDLGSWMWKNLNLGNPIHRLKWKLEELRIILKQLDNIDIEDKEQLKKIKEINTEYRNFEETLRGVPVFQ